MNRTFGIAIGAQSLGRIPVAWQRSFSSIGFDETMGASLSLQRRGSRNVWPLGRSGAAEYVPMSRFRALPFGSACGYMAESLAVVAEAQEVSMSRLPIVLSATLLSFALAQIALADENGLVTGAVGGAVAGAVVGGPVGAVVGGVGGAAIGNSVTNHRGYHRGYAYHPVSSSPLPPRPILIDRRRPKRGRRRGSGNADRHARRPIKGGQVPETDAASTTLPIHIEETIQSIAGLHAEHHANATPHQRIVDRITSLGPRQLHRGADSFRRRMAEPERVRRRPRLSRARPASLCLVGGRSVAGLPLFGCILILTTQRGDDRLNSAPGTPQS